MTASTDPLLSAQEVADYLGVPLATLYSWRYVGRGPRAYRVGKFLKFRSSEVVRWLEDQADRPRSA